MPGGFGRKMGRELTDEEKANKPKITKQLLKRIFSYLRPYIKQLILVFVCIIVSAILGVLPSMLTGRMIDDGLIQKDFDILVKLVAASFGVLLLSNAITALETYVNTWVAQHITYDMKNEMYAHMLTMSQRFFTQNRQGDVITRMTSDIDGVRTVVLNTMTSIFSNIAVVVTTAVALFEKNWVLALIGVGIVPLLTIPTNNVGKKRWRIALKVQEQNDKLNQELNETLSVSGQQLVKLFGNEKREYDKYKSINGERTRLGIRERMAGMLFWRTMNIFTSMGPMLIYLAGGFMIIKLGVTSLSVGDITVIVALLNRLYRPVDQLFSVQVDIVRSMALFTRIFEYLDLEPDIKNKPGALKPAETYGRVEFDSVSFCYQQGKKTLDDISFVIEPGSTVALVGPSGAGKSTIANLVPRLYDVSGGRVLIDGLDVRDLDLRYLRKSIGLVTQETYLFNGTIRENLLYAKADATDDELIKVCKDANIHDFIISLKDGYDTQVGNRGFKLSGGEKQRVSIARAMLKEPAIIILDEATSALDSISESLIQSAFERLLKGRTSLVIAHRLSTIIAADNILVLENGKIVQSGSHQQLVKQDGVYKNLYETQFKKAIDSYKSTQNQFGA
jgi:ABC transporter related